MKLCDRLKALEARGWTCEQPERQYWIDSHGASFLCVYCFGPVPGFAEIQTAHLDIGGGTVLLTGKHHSNFYWSEFIDLLDGKLVERKPLSGQRSLFEED